MVNGERTLGEKWKRYREKQILIFPSVRQIIQSERQLYMSQSSTSPAVKQSILVGFTRFQFSAHGSQLYKIISLKSSLNLIIWPPSAIVLYPPGTKWNPRIMHIRSYIKTDTFTKKTLVLQHKEGDSFSSIRSEKRPVSCDVDIKPIICRSQPIIGRKHYKSTLVPKLTKNFNFFNCNFIIACFEHFQEICETHLSLFSDTN